jgi:hypothetical protein
MLPDALSYPNNHPGEEGETYGEVSSQTGRAEHLIRTVTPNGSPTPMRSRGRLMAAARKNRWAQRPARVYSVFLEARTGDIFCQTRGEERLIPQ